MKKMDLILKRNIHNKSPTVKIITPRRRINRRMSVLKTSPISFDNKLKNSGTPVGKRLKIDPTTPILNNDDVHNGAGLEVEVVLGYSNYGSNEVLSIFFHSKLSKKLIKSKSLSSQGVRALLESPEQGR